MINRSFWKEWFYNGNGGVFYSNLHDQIIYLEKNDLMYQYWHEHDIKISVYDIQKSKNKIDKKQRVLSITIKGYTYLGDM